MNALPWHREVLERLMGRRRRACRTRSWCRAGAGIGKVEFAREFARSLLCESPIDLLACGQCPSCHWFGQSQPSRLPRDRPGGRGGGRRRGAEAETGEGRRQEEPRHQDRPGARHPRLRVAVHAPRGAPRDRAPSGRGAAAGRGQRAPQDARGAAAGDRDPARERPPGAAPRHDPQPLRVRRAARARPRRRRSRGSAEGGATDAGGRRSPSPAARRSSPRELARPEEREWRRKVVAELSRPDGAHVLSFAAGIRPGAPRAHALRDADLGARPRAPEERRRAAAPRRGGRRPSRPRPGARGSTGCWRSTGNCSRRGGSSAHPLNARLAAEHLMMAYNRATLG